MANRMNGILTSDDIRKLMSIHEHAGKIMNIAMMRLRLGSDMDTHPNSWWRNHDRDLEQQAEYLASDVQRFMKTK